MDDERFERVAKDTVDMLMGAAVTGRITAYNGWIGDTEVVVLAAYRGAGRTGGIDAVPLAVAMTDEVLRMVRVQGTVVIEGREVQQ